VEIGKIRPDHDHPMQDHGKLGVRLLADRLNLPLVAVAAGLLDEKRPEGIGVALAEHLAQLADVLAIARRHW
jgi:hypothetical protein